MIGCTDLLAEPGIPQTRAGRSRLAIATRYILGATRSTTRTMPPTTMSPPALCAGRARAALLHSRAALPSPRRPPRPEDSRGNRTAHSPDDGEMTPPAIRVHRAPRPDDSRSSCPAHSQQTAGVQRAPRTNDGHWHCLAACRRTVLRRLWRSGHSSARTVVRPEPASTSLQHASAVERYLAAGAAGAQCRR